MLLCCVTPSCFIMMCHAFMLRHTIICGSGCRPVKALAGQCITHWGNVFHVPTSCLPSNVAQSTHGQHNSAAHGSADVYSRELFISYEHTAEHWNLMQDSPLFLGVRKHTLVLESLVGKNPTYPVALASFQSRFNGLRTSHFKWRRGLQNKTFPAQLHHIPSTARF